MNAVRLAAIVAACLAVARPACADDASAVSANLTTAAAFVTSFVIEMNVNGTTGVGGTITVVRPMAFKSEMNVGRMTVQTYLIGNTVYINSPAAGWQRMPFDSLRSPQQAIDIADMLKKAHTTVLPDRQEDGITVGAVRIESPVPASAAPMIAQAANLVCTYDKTSYLMRTCVSGMLTLKYTKYNDPANVVILPAAAKSAVPITLKTPAAAAPAATGMPAAPTNPGPVPAGSPSSASPQPTDEPAPLSVPSAMPTP